MRTRTRRILLLILILTTLVAVAAGALIRRGMVLRDAAAHETADQLADSSEDLNDGIVPSVSDLSGVLATEHVYSHRGSAGINEHSFAAYDAAIEAGSRYIEQDLVLSSDGVLFVSHDLNAAAMTGVRAAYANMSAETIDGLSTYAGGKILRLSEIFDRYGRTINYVIELKSPDDSLIRAFTDIVDHYGYEDIITVQSKWTEVLADLDTYYPDMPKLYVCKNQTDFRNALDLPYVDTISVRYDLMTESNCEAAHSSGKLFSAWTLDTEALIISAIRMGVDTYFTNDTPLALALETQYGPEFRYHQSSEVSTSGGIVSTIFFASDYQAVDGLPSPAQNLTGILRSVTKSGKSPDNVVICGDYTNDRQLHDYQLRPDDSISEIRDIVRSECPGVSQDDMLFVQGNHDKMTDSISSSGLHEYTDYLVYILNTQDDFPWKQGRDPGSRSKVEQAASAMQECFAKLISAGEKRPVFIAGHVPLHFTARTSSRHSTGDNMYSPLIFNTVNEAAKSLDIVYMYGHNHSKGWDCYLGGSSCFKAPGQTILIPSPGDSTSSTDTFTCETLQFTYMNAGYLGYYMNCGPSEYDKGLADQYAAADGTLTGTVCEILPDSIVITRYAGDGPHPLCWQGEPDPYQNNIDSGLIGSDYYSSRIESPQTIKRKSAE